MSKFLMEMMNRDFVSSLFLTVLNMSFIGCFVIAAVMILRLFLKKAPKSFSYALWLLVLFRLLCPFSFESVLSLLPVRSKPIPADIVYQQTPQIYSGVTAIDRAVNEVLPQAIPHYSINPMQIAVAAAMAVWIVGMLGLLLYSLISMGRLRAGLRGAVHVEGNLYTAENLRTPFVLGIHRPRIYLPAGLSEQERRLIVRHEQTHIARRDPVVKLIAFLTVCIHWFNPLVWIAFRLMTEDMEMSCDERVVRTMGNGIKKDYSNTLLAVSSGRSAFMGAPLAFGEGEVKGRIRNVLDYKKPAVWGMLCLILVLILAAVTLLSNPQGDSEGSAQNTENGQETVNDGPQWLSKAYEWRTHYVGDNSAVGNIISSWDTLADAANDGFELQTAAEPYGVTIRYTAEMEPQDLYANYEAVLHEDAVILFSLVENLDSIEISVNGEPVGSYERNLEEEQFGNLWEQSETLEGLGTLYQTVNDSDAGTA